MLSMLKLTFSKLRPGRGVTTDKTTKTTPLNSPAQAMTTTAPTERETARTITAVEEMITTRLASATAEPSTTVASPATDFSASFFPECEVFWEGGEGPAEKHYECRKNPGHGGFLHVADFTIGSLPPECQSHETLDRIRNYCDRTVKITIKHTSSNRPDTWPGGDMPYPYNYLKGCDRAWRVGTGFLWNAVTEYGRCPCQLCKNDEAMDKNCYFMEVSVVTATHVIYDESEAATAIFDCFYDDPVDKTGVRYLYGVGMDNTYNDGGELERCLSDKCRVACVTHDKDLMGKLEDVMKSRQHPSINLSGLAFIVSHPHGMSKKLSLGTVSYYTMRQYRYFPKGVPHKLNGIIDYEANHRVFYCRVPVSFQLDDHHQHSDVLRSNSPSSSLSQQPCNVKNEHGSFNKSVLNLTPGVECTIRATTTFTLPLDARYVCRVRKDGGHLWVTFPPRTIFTLPDGRLLPPQTEFKQLDINDPFKQIGTDRCLNYDIPTCPGSSGARVVVGGGGLCFPWYRRDVLPHAGVSAEDGSNQSSYEWW